MTLNIVYKLLTLRFMYPAHLISGIPADLASPHRHANRHLTFIPLKRNSWSSLAKSASPTAFPLTGDGHSILPIAEAEFLGVIHESHPTLCFRFSPSGSSAGSSFSCLQNPTPSHHLICDNPRLSCHYFLSLEDIKGLTSLSDFSWDFLQLFSTQQPQKLWKCTVDPVTVKLKHWKGYLTMAYKFQPDQAATSSHLITSLPRSFQPSTLPSLQLLRHPQTQQICSYLRASVHLMFCLENSHLRVYTAALLASFKWLLQCLTSEATLTITLKTETHPHTLSPPGSFP